MALVEDDESAERLHEEFKRRIKTQCLLPCAETAAMLFWALLASGQITHAPGRRPAVVENGLRLVLGL